MTKIDIGELSNLSSKLNELRGLVLLKLRKLETSISEFDSEEKLKGIAWDTSKKHFTTGYLPITTAFITALELIVDRLDTYTRSFSMEVTTGHVQLDTDQLQDLLIRMQELSSIKAKWLHDMVDELAGIPGIGNIFNEISLNETKKEVILLQKFQEFESRHSADFDDILETLYYLQTGLDSLGDEKNFLGDQKGFFNSNIVNSPWYKKLTAFNKKHEDEIKLIQQLDAESAAMNAELTAQILNAQQNLNYMNDAMMTEVNSTNSYSYNPLGEKTWFHPEEMDIKKSTKVNSIDDILTTTSAGEITRGKSTQWNKQPGTFADALNDFNSMGIIDVRKMNTSYGTGYFGKLPDGRTINVRPGSSGNNMPTIEIINLDGTRIKIRYFN